MISTMIHTAKKLELSEIEEQRLGSGTFTRDIKITLENDQELEITLFAPNPEALQVKVRQETTI